MLTHVIKIDDADKKEATEKFSTMSPHPEVPAALCKLRGAYFRLFTLTDYLLEVQTRQLEHGEIVDFFERRSADAVKHHKPSIQAYTFVERECVELRRRSSASSHVIQGTRLALRRPAGKQRRLDGLGTMSWVVGP